MTPTFLSLLFNFDKQLCGSDEQFESYAPLWFRSVNGSLCWVFLYHILNWAIYNWCYINMELCLVCHLNSWWRLLEMIRPQCGIVQAGFLKLLNQIDWEGSDHSEIFKLNRPELGVSSFNLEIRFCVDNPAELSLPFHLFKSHFWHWYKNMF